MDNEILNRIKVSMIKAFPNAEIPEDISDLRYGSFDDWDSLGNFAFLMLIEQEFDFEFTMTDLSEIRSVTEILTKIIENES